ncbi:LysR family transcriptional regulator [Cytobacillus purgationiresistens]|uniref:DNA-binding transcriptional LysR family regulator n=1 Tax=Cytobacillus purgationiresistens TaxID=863449 RepID=A0ABU0AAP4_9BACI|nr:LysR family transcriptional regulator [Cytobacillus purgationiresistens]MDQ0268316.1 DNA-binding transcriptional LysR family regulator [Cytobacillus purgationiresistens]
MSLVKYEVFSKVAELGSFTKTADFLGLTQSAVSHAIANLEKEFGFSLVQRSRSGITLTNEGHALLLNIRKVLHYDEQLHQEAAKITGLTKGTVRVGTFTSVSSKWLPEIINIMEIEFPNIRIELIEGDYFEIEKGILNGKIDCGFINVDHSNHFDIITLKKDRLLCIVSKQNALSQQKTIQLTQLVDVPFIMPTYGGYHEVKFLFENSQLQPNIRFGLMAEDSIKSMVAHDLGVSILPEMLLETLPSGCKAIPLAQDSYRVLGLATRFNLSPATKQFVEVTKRWIKEQ